MPSQISKFLVRTGDAALAEVLNKSKSVVAYYRVSGYSAYSGECNCQSEQDTKVLVLHLFFSILIIIKFIV
jgi:hypothetical protein